MADSGWNLPPGCFEHHIPGNRPQDVAYERAVEDVTDDWADKCSEHETECEDVLVYRGGDEEFVRCGRGITALSVPSVGETNHTPTIVCVGDPSECPYFENEVEKRTEAIMNNDDAPEWDDF